jgi:hypothetical protein
MRRQFVLQNLEPVINSWRYDPKSPEKRFKLYYFDQDQACSNINDQYDLRNCFNCPFRILKPTPKKFPDVLLTV